MALLKPELGFRVPDPSLISINFMVSFSVTCEFQIGDGHSKKEINIGTFTQEECIAEGKKRKVEGEQVNGHPITGITINRPCPGKCKCFMEYGMTGVRQKPIWQSCFLA